MTNKKVARILTCEDERLHDPDAEMIIQIRELLKVDVIFVGTEAGPEGAVLNHGIRFSGAVRNASIIEGAKHPDVFALVAHYDCAGHPVGDEQHDHDVVTAAKMLSVELFNEPDKVVPVIAYQNPQVGSSPSWLFKRMDSESVALAAE